MQGRIIILRGTTLFRRAVTRHCLLSQMDTDITVNPAAAYYQDDFGASLANVFKTERHAPLIKRQLSVFGVDLYLLWSSRLDDYIIKRIACQHLLFNF